MLPVDSKKLHKKAKIQIFVTKAERTVTIPEETESGKPEGVEVEATEHTEIQALLLKLGKEMSFDTWVARNDKSKEFEGKLLGGFPGVRNLPRQARPKYAPAKEQKFLCRRNTLSLQHGQLRCGAAEPVVEKSRADAWISAGGERLIVYYQAEVTRINIGDHLAWILRCT